MATYSSAPNKFIFIFSGLIILGVVLYYAYILSDRYFLSETSATATVVGKEYLPLSEKYQNQNIGGRNQTVKIMVPEAWMFTFDVAGQTSQAQVSREIFETTKAGAKMNIRYKKFRITGTWQVTQVLDKVEG
jgi:hypothetical protein